jgi:hypothetical protein
MCSTSAILTPLCLSEPWTLIEEDKPKNTIVEVNVLRKTEKKYLLVEHKTTEDALKERKMQSVLGKVSIPNYEWADPDCRKLS